MNEIINEKQKFKTMREDSFMKKILQKRLNQKGLTLIELLAVIVILAIIAAIAIPAIGNLINNSRFNAVKSDAITALNAANLYFTENPNEGTVTIDKLVTDGYLQNPGTLIRATPGNLITKGTSGNQHSITHETITYSGGSVSFTNATVTNIQAAVRNGDTLVAITSATAAPSGEGG